MLRTKIICTLGPATSKPDDIAAVVACGMDVARLNMAHGEEDDRARMVESVRAAARLERRPVALLADLGGPKIRVGRLTEPVPVSLGDEIVMAYGPRATGEAIPTTYERSAEDMRRGIRVAIDDGLIGINNRNLKTLRTDIETTRRLAPQVPGDRLTVGESGLSSPADLASMEAAGVTTFLIGEALMSQNDVKAATEALLRREAA